MKLTKKSKRDLMYQNIQKHGDMLNALFNTGIESVALCKKLRRLEVKAYKLAADYCNGENGVDSENIDTFTQPILKAVMMVLKLKPSYPMSPDDSYPVQFNRDARGYALKLSDEWVAEKQANIYKDWGGYGILAPDFRVN